jgi:hypothetical protein
MTSRRDALVSVLAALGAACRPSADTLRLVTGNNPTAGDHRLLVALGLDGIVLSALLEHAPSRNQLAQILGECRPRCQELSTVGTDREVRATLCNWIAEDFACGALTEVDGWQLARSEAMILALLAAQRV